MTKPRIKAKWPAPDAEMMQVMEDFAQGAGMLTHRQYFAYQVVTIEGGQRFPVAIAPFCYTPMKAAKAISDARAESAEFIGMAGTVEWFDPDDPDALALYGARELEAQRERAEWERKK